MDNEAECLAVDSGRISTAVSQSESSHNSSLGSSVTPSDEAEISASNNLHQALSSNFSVTSSCDGTVAGIHLRSKDAHNPNREATSRTGLIEVKPKTIKEMRRGKELVRDFETPISPTKIEISKSSAHTTSNHSSGSGTHMSLQEGGTVTTLNLTTCIQSLSSGGQEKPGSEKYTQISSSTSGNQRKTYLHKFKNYLKLRKESPI